MDNKKQILKLAEKMAENLSLVEIYLKDVNASRARDQDGPPKSANVSLTTSVSLQEQSKPEIFSFDIVFTVNAVNTKSNETLFHIEMNFLATYLSKGNFTPQDKEWEAFGETNVVFNTWPYAREMVHNTMARMNLPVFFIPSIKIGDLVSFQQKSKELNAKK